MALSILLRHGCPGCPAGASKMLIIAEILAGQHLSQKNDLAGMHREVLHNMRNSLQHRDIVTLGRNSFGEACGRDRADNRRNFGDPGVQKFGQLRGLFAATRIELGIALAMVGQASHARTNPLAHVPRKMQHEITDRVLVLGIAGPDLLRRQTAEAILNAAVQLFQLVGRELDKDLVRCHKTSSAQFSRIDFTFPVNWSARAPSIKR